METTPIQDKERIEEVTGRDTRLDFVRCCDEFDCPKCWGSGGWHRLVYVSCRHEVFEPNGQMVDQECYEDFCIERERVAKEIFPERHPELKSLFEVQSERENR